MEESGRGRGSGRDRGRRSDTGRGKEQGIWKELRVSGRERGGDRDVQEMGAWTGTGCVERTRGRGER